MSALASLMCSVHMLTGPYKKSFLIIIELVGSLKLYAKHCSCYPVDKIPSLDFGYIVALVLARVLCTLIIAGL